MQTCANLAQRPIERTMSLAPHSTTLSFGELSHRWVHPTMLSVGVSGRTEATFRETDNLYRILLHSCGHPSKQER